MNDKSEGDAGSGASNAMGIGQILLDKVDKWRGELRDIGNRNPLVNCSFNPSRGVIKVVTPDCESLWRKLMADSEAGVDPMRFAWRHELVPPRVDTESKPSTKTSRAGTVKLLRDTATADSTVQLGDTMTRATVSPVVEWNPSLDACRTSPLLRETDLLTDVTDRVLDRRLRTFNAHARLAMSEQSVHGLYIAFGFLKWFGSKDSTKELCSPLILMPVTLSRKSTSAAWELTETEDDAIDNFCLLQRLRQDFSLELPLLPDLNELEEPGARTAFLNSLRAAITQCDRWEVEDRAAIGPFAFPKVAMRKDLGDRTNAVINHSLCRSIGSDTTLSGRDRTTRKQNRKRLWFRSSCGHRTNRCGAMVD